MGQHRNFLIIAVVFLVMGLTGLSCSDKESSEPEKPNKIVMPIKRPQKKLVHEEKIQVTQQASARGQESDQEDETEKVADRTLEHPPMLRQEQEPEQEPREEEEQIKQPEPSPQELTKYVTQKGDTLFSVSGKRDVFSDPFKWPCLLRLNLAALKELEMEPGLENKELPPGIELFSLTSQQIQEKKEKMAGARWAINIFSDKTSKRISRLVIKLIENDIPVYIARANIRGEVWLRLRSGFFKNRQEAREVQEKIKQITGLDGVWITKVSDTEFNKFADCM